MIFFISDLVFKSRVREVLGENAVRFCRNGSEYKALDDKSEEVVVDLSLKKEDPLLVIREVRAISPDARIVAFGSHVEGELLQAARAAGATEVMANSGFVKWLETRRAQKGGGFWTLLVFGAIAASALWYLFHLIPIWYRYYDLDNLMNSMAKVSSDLNDKEFRRRLVTLMKEAGIPGDVSAVLIDKTGDSVRMQYSYNESIEFELFDTTYTVQKFHFNLDVDGSQ